MEVVNIYSGERAGCGGANSCTAVTPVSCIMIDDATSTTGQLFVFNIHER